MSERTRWAKRAKQRSANEQVLVDANKSLLKRIAELEAELRLTVTTAYHDEIVAEATKQLVVKDERIAELELALTNFGALRVRMGDRRPCDLSHELADWCQCGWRKSDD